MDILDLFEVALMPVLKTLLIALVGLFLVLERVNIMDGAARHHLNNLVFYIFFPSLLASNLIGSISADNIVSLWFIPVSTLITFIIGSALGWALAKNTRTPRHLQGLVISCCAAGNMGNLPVIIIPAICAEKNNPFGDSSTCTKNGMAYVSLSMAMGAIFVWSYSFNIIKAYGTEDNSNSNINSTISKLDDSSEPLLSYFPNFGDTEVPVEITEHGSGNEASVFHVLKQRLKALDEKFNLRILLRPPTIASIVGILIGISPLREVMVGDSAPLRVIESAVLMLGWNWTECPKVRLTLLFMVSSAYNVKFCRDAAIPSMTLITGANLLKGLKSSGASFSVIFGMLIVRFILLPICGICVIKFAQNFGMVGSDPLYHFVLLLQYAVPPAMAIGTITQLFKIGETECSVFLFWNYAAAGIALTLWSTYFMWILS